MKPHRRTSRADSLTSRFGLACCYEHASSEPSLQPQLRLTETGGNDHRRGVPVCIPRHCLWRPFSAKTIHPDLPRGLRAAFCVCNLGAHIRGLREHEPSLRRGGLPHCCAHRRGTRFPITLSRRQYRTQRLGRTCLPYLVAAVFRLFGSYSPASALILLALQCMMAAATGVAIFALGLRSLGERIGLLAACIWTLSPIFFRWPTSLIWDFAASALLLTVAFVMTLRHRGKRYTRELAVVIRNLGADRAHQSCIAQSAAIQPISSRLGKSQSRHSVSSCANVRGDSFPRDHCAMAGAKRHGLRAPRILARQLLVRVLSRQLSLQQRHGLGWQASRRQSVGPRTGIEARRTSVHRVPQKRSLRVYTPIPARIHQPYAAPRFMVLGWHSGPLPGQRMVAAMGILAALAGGLARITLCADKEATWLAFLRRRARGLSDAILSGISSCQVSLRHRTRVALARYLSSIRSVGRSRQLSRFSTGRLKPLQFCFSFFDTAC